MTRVVLVPGALALLPEYAGVVDPIPDLRRACADAVGWLADDASKVGVLANAQGTRVARQLLTGANPAVKLKEDTSSTERVLVVANGSARRTKQSPGPYDERAAGFDADLEARLRHGDTNALAALDEDLAAELWVGAPAQLRALAHVLAHATPAQVDYADDPFGVQYWVMRWDQQD